MKFLIMFLILLFPIGLAHADQYGISLGKTCKTMIKQNMTGCPTYEMLSGPFPDNTDKKAVGEFKTINGFLQRDHPQYKHPEKYYTYHKGDITWLDPPEDVRKTIKMITIEASLPEYKIGEESNKMNDYNIKFGKDRYINQNCSEIKITARNWLFMTGDAMNLLKHDCDLSVSNFNATTILKFQKSYQNIATSNKYKLDNFVKLAKEKYKTSYIGSNEIINNTAVTTHQDQ